MKELLRIDLKTKTFMVLEDREELIFALGDDRVVIPQEKRAELLAILDFVFLGILKDRASLQGKNGYLVFVKGQDRWGIRLGSGQDRQVVYLSRYDIRVLYYKVLLG